jgi:protease I
MENIGGLRVAILIADGFEQVEMTEPRKALDQAGADTRIVSPKPQKVRGWNFTDWGDEFPVDVPLDRAHAADFDALLLPGGVLNPDTLRIIPSAVAFAKSFFDARKPVAAICHGPWTVIEAGAARGRRIASWPSLKTDLRNGGAEWVDRAVVVDGNLVSSRKPDDIPAFNREMIALFGRARGSVGAEHGEQAGLH